MEPTWEDSLSIKLIYSSSNFSCFGTKVCVRFSYTSWVWHSFQSHIPCFEHPKVCENELILRNWNASPLSSNFIIRSLMATQRLHISPFSVRSTERENKSQTCNYKRYIGRFFVLPFFSFWNSSLSTSSLIFLYFFYSLNFLSPSPRIFLSPAVIFWIVSLQLSPFSSVNFYSLYSAFFYFLPFHFFLFNSLSPAFASLHLFLYLLLLLFVFSFSFLS